jgi:ABC-type transport system involved in multi-copper enzyme maturation permease subunit
VDAVNAILNLMQADFYERVRRFSFLVVVGVTVAVGYSLVPASTDPYNGFVIYGYRGVYNSVWIGTIFGLVVASLVSLIGFYLVRDAVNRDYQTRVGQIIATTPISRLKYALGKWLSNLAVLAAIMAILTVMALIMQFIRAEDTSLSLGALLVSIWGMGLPVMAWVAAVAVLFETTPLLRGTLGHIAYPALWAWIMLGLTVGPMFFNPSTVTPTHRRPSEAALPVDWRLDECQIPLG